MLVRCDKCHRRYNDADCWTICPHDRFISPEDAARKDSAIKLLGKDVRFAHQDSGPYYRVQAVGADGMICISGMTGEFAPHLFIPKNT